MDSQMRILMRYANLADLLISSYPRITSASSLAWNTELYLGSATPSITLPAIANTEFAQEIRIIFIASGTTASFTAPTGAYIADDEGFGGLSTGNTLSLTDLTVGSYYELSFVVLDATHIATIVKEWATASE